MAHSPRRRACGILHATVSPVVRRVSTGKFGRWNMGQAREAAAMLADGSTLLERASAPPEVSMSDEQLVLLDISGAHYYTLEGPVAIRIWQLLATRQ